MSIRELFVSDVTRDIPPVVYFHEQSPTKLRDEVGEYIVTGGFPDDHPGKKRVPEGIHEQYVRLLENVAKELDRAGGPDLPSSWISGFYGSGKSSFAKLLGLALDGVALPDGRALSDALLSRDTSPRADELRRAWKALRERIDPIAVVFDIGGVARDDEHIHAAVVRQLQVRLGYCATQSNVADFELRLERDGAWAAFEKAAAEHLPRPWADVKQDAMAEDDFSLVLSQLYPERYPDPMAWIMSRAGTSVQASSAEEATKAIADMLRFRAPGKTLFIVVDEVSQYIHQDQQRMLKLQSFVSELGQRLKGGAWLFVTGQQKLEEAGAGEVLGKLKDRFKPALRVHLSTTNIRDVVHKRLLQKTAEAAAALRELFKKHRNDLRLFAYACDDVTEEDFVECYPMLPGHIDLMLQITTALRTRSTRSQGDDQAIRGLLQLLGELFRAQKLAEMPVGSLVTLDRIYEVQRSALDADVQTTMDRIARHGGGADDLAHRAAKAVALLELIQETMPTTITLVAQCLFDRLDRGAHEDAVRDALEGLRRENLLGYSEKLGYKIQSTSGEEWARERDDIAVPRDALAESVRGALTYLLSQLDRPRLEGRGFPWMAWFSDGERDSDAVLLNPRDPAHVAVDLRRLPAGDRALSTWVNRSAEPELKGRILWIAGETADLDAAARISEKSLRMVARHEPRRSSLSPERQRLLIEEKTRAEEHEGRVQTAAEAAWMGGALYFRGRTFEPRELGTSFRAVLETMGERVIRDIYPHYLATQVSPAELAQLLVPDLSAPSPKFVDEVGILSLDAGRYEATCGGEAPRGILDFLKTQPGISGATLIQHFGGSPYGFAAGVVRACVAGLLRGSRVTVQPESGPLLTAVRDAGVVDLFEKDRDFKRASFHPADEGEVDRKTRARICAVLEKHLGLTVDREADAIAEAVARRFPDEKKKLEGVLTRLRELPADRGEPEALVRLDQALEACVRDARWTAKAVSAVKRHLDALNDGLEQLALLDAELTDEAMAQLRVASDVARYQLSQLGAAGALDEEHAGAGQRIRAQLAGEKPWRDLPGIADDLDAVKARYVDERGRILASYGERAEEVRGAVKRRDGFATLTADQSHHVLRPVNEAIPSTTVDAISPTLLDLKKDRTRRFDEAAERANERLDELLSQHDSTPIRRVEVDLKNREVATVAELDALLDEVRSRVLPEIEAGRRVRIV